MKHLVWVLLLALAATGCKDTGWTFLSRSGGESLEPLPEQPAEPEGQDARDIIFVLGIDGMD